MNKRPINLGVSGLGRAFSFMLWAFVQDPRINLVAAFDPRESARDQFAKEFNAEVHARFEDLANNNEVDAIYIACPHEFHADQSCIAAEHGKHVLVEKPMALTLADCDRMLETFHRHGVQLVIGHSHSFDTPYLQARDIIRNNEFGAVKMLHAVNYTDFLYRPRRPEELDTNKGGGVIFNQAIHQVDILRLLADSPAIRLRSITGAWDPKRPTEGAYAALLWFKSGAFASFLYSGYAHFDSDEWCNWISEAGATKKGWSFDETRARLKDSKSAEQEAELKYERAYGNAGLFPGAGEKNMLHQHFGTVIVSCEHADLRPLPHAVLIYSDNGLESRTLPENLAPRSEVIDELHAAVVEGQKPLHDGYWGKSTLEICLALLESSAGGRDIDLEHQV